MSIASALGEYVEKVFPDILSMVTNYRDHQRNFLQDDLTSVILMVFGVRIVGVPFKGCSDAVPTGETLR